MVIRILNLINHAVVISVTLISCKVVVTEKFLNFHTVSLTLRFNFNLHSHDTFLVLLICFIFNVPKYQKCAHYQFTVYR